MDDARVERPPYARDETSSLRLTFLLPLGQFIFRYRNAMFPIILVVLFLGLRPRVYLSGYWELVFDLMGLLVAGFGQALHVAVLGTTQIKRGGLNKRVYADRLETDGCFAHCRNPIYVGNLLILTGLLIVFNNVLAFVFAGIFFITAYSAIIVAEEAFLLRQFGQGYRSYCEQVPRWWPTFKGLRSTLRCTSLNCRLAVSKTYSSTYAWMAVGLLVLGYRAWLSRGLGQTGEWVGLGIAFVVFTGLFLLARYMRKNGLLNR